MTDQKWIDIPKEVPTPKVIGIFGEIGTGKNYLLEKILLPALKQKGLGVVVLAFADALKLDSMRDKGYTFMQVFAETKAFAVRCYLQDYGESERKKDSDVWLKRLHSQILLHAYRGVDVILIADMRHVNEAEYIKQLGGLRVCIDAPTRNHNKLMRESGGDMEKYNHIKNHISERALDKYADFSLRLANDPLEEETAGPTLCNIVYKYIAKKTVSVE